jgi:hypothetical protein
MGEDARELLAARLVAQRLAGEPCADALSATRHLLAVQAQDPRAARLAVRARTAGAHASDVDHALTQERSLVITWVSRGTLHLVAAEDEAFLHAVTTPQLRTGSERRLRQEGVSPTAADRGVAVLVRALGEQGPLTRTQIRDRLERADIPTRGQALVHLLFRATLDGLIVRGPMIAGEHAFVLRDDWLGPRPRIARDAALAELSRRYLRGHGPADERDLARWAQLPLRDARRGLSTIARELESRPRGLVALRGSAPAAALPPPRLLGAFDPLLLGWRSRDFVLSDARHVVTANGIFRAVALVGGRVAGTWGLAAGRVELRLWDEPNVAVAAALSDEAQAVVSFLAPRAPA